MSGNSTSETSKYRKLLIFVLAFQAILATGWIVYDNYANYIESPNQIALSSLLASGTGLVIVLLVWYLLSSAEKENSVQIENTHQKVSKSEEDFVLEAKETAFTPKESIESTTHKIQSEFVLDDAILWEYNQDRKAFYNLDKSVEINFPEAATLYEKLQNAEVLDFKKLEDDKISSIALFNEKAVLALPLKEKGTLQGMVTAIRDLGSPWQQEELRKLITTKQIFENSLQEYKKLQKLSTLENNEKYWIETTAHPAIATAVFKLLTPVAAEQLDKNKIEEVSIQSTNKNFDENLSHESITELISNNLSKLISEDSIQFYLSTNKDDSDQHLNYNCFAKLVYHRAEVQAIVFSAISESSESGEHSIYNKLIENSEDIFLTVNSNYTIQFTSKSAANNFGIDASKTNEDYNILSFVPSTGYDILEQALKNTIEKGERQYLNELPFRNKENQITAFDCILYPVETMDDSKEIALELRIIEERLQLEHSMEKKQQLLSDLLNLTDDVITIVDEQGIILFESENMQEHHGYDKSQRIGTYGFEYIAPKATQKVHDDFEKVKNFPAFKANREIDFLNKNGNWEKVILQQVNMLENELVNGIVLKITKVHTSLLHASTAEDSSIFNAIFDNSDNAALILNEEGNILHANNAISKMLHYSSKEIEGQKFFNFIHTKEKAAIQNNFDYLESTPNDSLNTNFHIKNSKGTWQKVEAIFKAVEQENKQKTLIVTFNQSDSTISEKEPDIAFRARFYNTLLSSTDNILSFADFNANIKYVNPVGKSILGYQLKGNLKERLHSDIHSDLLLALEKIKNQHSFKEQITAQIIDKDGNWKECLISIKNALSFSSFKGALLEISFKKEERKDKGEPNTIEKTAIAWLDELEKTGVAFLMKDGNLLYKNQKLEELLQQHINIGTDIQQAVKEENDLQQLFKKALQIPEEVHVASFQTKNSKPLLFEFNNVNGNKREKVLVLSVKEEEEIKVEAVIEKEKENIEDSIEVNPIPEAIDEKENNIEEAPSATSEEENKETPIINTTETVTAEPEKLQLFEGEPELINANEILEKTINNYREKFPTEIAIVKEFKNDTWLVCKQSFLEKIIDTIFSILTKGNTSNAGKIMITAQKEDKMVIIGLSENFSENSLKKMTEGFKSGELEEGLVKELHEYGEILASYQGGIRVQCETDRGISFNLQLPAKIGVSF